jgi:hypothetical protein
MSHTSCMDEFFQSTVQGEGNEPDPDPRLKDPGILICMVSKCCTYEPLVHRTKRYAPSVLPPPSPPPPPSNICPVTLHSYEVPVLMKGVRRDGGRE